MFQKSSFNSSLYLVLLFGWLGAVPMFLDWNQPWHSWPNPVIWGLNVGHIVEGTVNYFIKLPWYMYVLFERLTYFPSSLAIRLLSGLFFICFCDFFVFKLHIMFLAYLFFFVFSLYLLEFYHDVNCAMILFQK